MFTRCAIISIFMHTVLAESLTINLCKPTNSTIEFINTEISGVIQKESKQLSGISCFITLDRLPNTTYVQLELVNFNETGDSPGVEMLDGQGNHLSWVTRAGIKQITVASMIMLKFTGGGQYTANMFTIKFTMSSVHSMQQLKEEPYSILPKASHLYVNTSGYISSADNYTLPDPGSECEYVSSGFRKAVSNYYVLHASQHAVGFKIEMIALNTVTKDQTGNPCSYYDFEAYLYIRSDGTVMQETDNHGKWGSYDQRRRFSCDCLQNLKPIDVRMHFVIRYTNSLPVIEFTTESENIRQGFLLKYDFIFCDVEGRGFETIHRQEPTLFFSVTCSPGYRLFHNDSEYQGEIECTWTGEWKGDPRCLPENYTVWLEDVARNTSEPIREPLSHNHTLLEATIIPVIVLLSLLLFIVVILTLRRRFLKAKQKDDKLQLRPTGNKDSCSSEENDEEYIEIDDLTEDDIVKRAAKLKRPGIKQCSHIVEVEIHHSHDTQVNE